MVTIEALHTVHHADQSKVRRDHVDWHADPLPRDLEQPGSSADRGAQHDSPHSDRVPLEELKGDVLSLWQNQTPHLMGISHGVAALSAYCARHGLTVADPVSLNGMPDVTTPDGQKPSANLVSHRDPSILCVYPSTPIVPGWTDDMRAIQMAFFMHLVTYQATRRKHFVMM